VTLSSPAADPRRRGFLVRVILAVQAAIAGTLGYVLGGTILSPSFAAHDARWLPAASLDDLDDGAPTPITLRIARQDGYRQVIDRRVVYLTREATGEVRALDSTCTHLGCRTRYDAGARRFVCPCHGGAYDVDGQVMAGPPPQPLRRLQARVEDDRVFVRV
jgi:Rieske Fe-S protein